MKIIRGNDCQIYDEIMMMTMILSIQLNLKNATGLKLQQNKDGFQKNDAYHKLLAKMDEQLRRHCSQAMHKS